MKTAWPRAHLAAAWAACAFFLSACGGGGGSGPSDPTATPLPASVQLSLPVAIEVAADQAFATDVPAGATGLQFSWDFGDGGTSTEARPQHRYATAARYTVRVTVRDAAGRAVSAQGSVDVVPALRVHGLECSGSADKGWCLQHPQGSPSDLHDLQWVGTTTAWAVGEGGAVMQTRDAGATWNRERIDGAPRLAALKTLDAQRGWVVGWALGGEGRAWRTVDGGATWTAADASVPVAFPRRLHLLSDDVLLVWGARPGSPPAITEDGGRSWRLLGMDVRHVESDGTLWAVPATPDGGFYRERPFASFQKSTDRGRTFVDEAAWPVNGRVDLMGVSSGGWAWALSFQLDADFPARRFTLLVRRGAGAPWTPATLPPRGEAVRLVVTPTGSLAVTSEFVAHSETLWHSADGGGSWTQRPWPLDPVPLWGLVDGQAAHAGRLHTERPWVSVDSGLTWAQDRPGVGLPGGHNVMAVQQVSDGLLMKTSAAFGPNARASWQLSLNGGRSWSDLTRPSTATAQDEVTELWFRDRRLGLAVTRGGTVLETTNGGRNWIARDPASLPERGAAPLTHLQPSPDGSLWAVANGQLWRSADDGRSWAPAPTQPAASSDPRASLQDFGFIGPQQLYAVQTGCFINPHSPVTCSSTVHRSDDNGRSWRALPMNACHRVAYASATQAVCVGTDAVSYSTDGGLTWTAATGATAAGVNVRRITWGAAGSGAPGWWLLLADGLLHSRNDGRTWQAVPLPALPLRLDESGAAVRVTLNDMTFDGRRGWIVGDEGVVYASEDGGATWALQPSGVQRVLNKVFAVDADSVWIGADGPVLATATGGR